MAKAKVLTSVELRAQRSMRAKKLDAFMDGEVEDALSVLQAKVEAADDDEATKFECEHGASTLLAVLETFRVTVDAAYMDPGGSTVAAVNALNKERPKTRRASASTEAVDEAAE